MTHILIEGNWIGVNESDSPLPNLRDGISGSYLSGITIGGTTSNGENVAGNDISFNSNDGVQLEYASGVDIVENTINSNGGTGVKLTARRARHIGIRETISVGIMMQEFIYTIRAPIFRFRTMISSVMTRPASLSTRATVPRKAIRSASSMPISPETRSKAVEMVADKGAAST